MATGSIEMANQAMGAGARGAGLGQPHGLVDEAPTPNGRFYGEEAKPQSTKTPPAVAIEGAVTSRVVRLALSNAPYEEILAADDPDTGVITVQIGCQSRPLQTWRRVGETMIRRQWGYDQERLSKALTEVLDRMEAEFAK